VRSHDDRPTVSVNPTTGDWLWSVPVGHRDDVDDAVRAGAESLGSSGSGVEDGLPGRRAATRLAVVAVGGANISTTEPEDHT
jgi:hypothetical protein